MTGKSVHRVSLYVLIFMIFMSILYKFIGNDRHRNGAVRLPEASIVNFKSINSSSSYDPNLPWWEQRSKEACKRLLFDDFYINLTSDRGSCSLRASKAGNNQKVISYTLYGTKQAYWENMDRILQTAKKIYPGWVVRLYTDPRLYQQFLCPQLIKHPHFYICDITNLPVLGDQIHMNPLMWRMLPLGDPQVRVFIGRDLDSELLEREAAAVDHWLKARTLLHIMRDHPKHKTLAVPGDTWGIYQPPSASKRIQLVKSNIFKVPRHKDLLRYYLLALRAYLMSALKASVLQHDSYSCSSYDNTKPFPTRRRGGKYVGNSVFRAGHNDEATESCPVECRPRLFKTWTSC